MMDAKKNKRTTVGWILTIVTVLGIAFFCFPPAALAAPGFESQVNAGTTEMTNLLKRIAPGLIVAVITLAALALLGGRKLREWAQDHIGYAILAVFVICIATAGVSYFFDLFGS
ncbi:hypothetical protein HB837_14510 [Listeria innocua]|uniref:hypothetical protein n=1 Tax=Listeria innocua TaxID=1642 RepID=UPI001624F980|nr:hypothetical protein [Listeria innocua]EBF5204390.1 hypothetical protein [Listeria monocytogenes]MBC1339408.1 hypothetical protein [Listeria innocua]MBC1353648.1 hypothetical protein [Listeria innocua]